MAQTARTTSLLAVVTLAFVGCQKSAQQSAGNEGTAKSGVKSITVVRHRFVFGEPEKAGQQLSLTTFAYDSSGDTTERLIYDNAGVLEMKTTYQYDGQGRLLSSAAYEKSGVSEELTTTTDSYNQAGKIIADTIRRGNEAFMTRSYAYKATGELSEDVLTLISPRHTDRTTYRYDARGRVIEEGFTGDATSRGKVLSAYSDDGNVIEKDAYDAEGQLKMKTMFTYDDKKRLLESDARSSPENLMEKKSTYVYDDSGRLTQRSDVRYSETGEPEDVDVSTYAYAP